VWWKAPAAQDATQPYSFVGFTFAGGSDSIDAQLLQVSGGTRVLIFEATSCGACAGSTITLPALNAWYKITIQAVQNGTHSMSVYDASGAQVGSTITHAASGNFAPVGAYFGDSHGSAGTTTSNFYYFDNFQVDYVNGTFPLLP
jgi:hypothetical protein